MLRSREVREVYSRVLSCGLVGLVASAIYPESIKVAYLVSLDFVLGPPRVLRRQI